MVEDRWVCIKICNIFTISTIIEMILIISYSSTIIEINIENDLYFDYNRNIIGGAIWSIFYDKVI